LTNFSPQTDSPAMRCNVALVVMVFLGVGRSQDRRIIAG
jgi:hypothetical protein